MIKSLSSDLFRFVRSKLFYVALILTLLSAVFAGITRIPTSEITSGKDMYGQTYYIYHCTFTAYSADEDGKALTYEDIYYRQYEYEPGYAFAVPLIYLVFVLSFEIKSSKHKTTVNKISAGISRLSIFTSKSLLYVFTYLIQLLVYFGTTIAMMFIVSPRVPAPRTEFITGVILYFLATALIVIAATLLITGLINCFGQIMSILLAAMVIIASLGLSMVESDKLAQDEYYYATEEAAAEDIRTPNPLYVGGNARKALVIAYRLNPITIITGGILEDHDAGKDAENKARTANLCASLILTVLTGTAAAVCYKKMERI